MALPLNVVDYLSVPELDVQQAVALGVALLRVVPSGLPAVVREPAQNLRGTILSLQSGWAERSGGLTESLCSAGVRLEKAWGALHHALKAVARLPKERERSHLGRRLLRGLFPDGAQFASLRPTEQWQESVRILEVIRSESLARPISLATGHPEFLEELKDAHEAYAQVQEAVDNQQPSQSAESLRHGLAQIRAATSDYILQLAAWCHREGNDNAGFEAMQAALQPVAGLLCQGLRASDTPLRVSGILLSDDADDDREYTSSLRATPCTPVPVVA